MKNLDSLFKSHNIQIAKRNSLQNLFLNNSLEEVNKGGGDSSNLSCFPAGTQILLQDGKSKEIEKIAVGEVVMGFDGLKSIPVIVEEIETPLRNHHFVLTFDNGLILKLTREHPLLTKGGWKSISPESTFEEITDLKVEKLGIGDRVYSKTGTYGIIINISFVAGDIQTFNLKRLSQLNSFYVNGFLAHNKSTS